VYIPYGNGKILKEFSSKASWQFNRYFRGRQQLTTNNQEEMVYQWESDKQLILVRVTNSDEALLSLLYDKCIWLHSKFTYQRLSEFVVGLSTFEGSQGNDFSWQADGEKQCYSDLSVLRRSDGRVNMIMSYEKIVSMSVGFSSAEFTEFVQGLQKWKTKIALIMARK
jgi:hypothetical protein